MKLKKFYFILLLILSSLSLTGCSNIFIASNTVLTLSSEMKPTANINSLITEQPGKVRSITNDRENILSISQNNNTYAIDNFQVKSNTLVNLIYSETQIFDVQAAGEGFFYSRINPSDSTNIQIIWSTFDKTVERTITDSLDAAGEIIYAYDNDKVVYINNGSTLVFSNSNGVKNKYELNFQAEISNLYWSDRDNVGFIIARVRGADSFDLYQLLPNGDDLKVNPIASNVIDMDFQKTTSQLVYLTQSNHNVECYILENIQNIKNTRIFGEENLEKVSFNDTGDSLYVAKTFGNGVRSAIWYYDLNTKKQYQIISPMRLISNIYSVGEYNIVYSVSQLTYLEASNIIRTNYYISHLTFDINLE